MNPFKYGQVVKQEDFCPRPLSMKQLRSFIESGQNVLVTGERRIGKTSLICRCAESLGGWGFIYADLLEVKSADDLCRRLIRALVSSEKDQTFLTRVLQGLAGMRPVLTFDPITGQPCISLDRRVVLEPDSIRSVMELMGERGEKGKLLVVLDEFQDILNLKEHRSILAEMRSEIQFQSGVSYVFSGSIRNRMNSVFFDSESPFFKSATLLEIGPVEPERFSGFLREKFVHGKRMISRELILEVIEMLASVPGDVQEFCCALWDCSSRGDKITKRNFRDAFRVVFARESKAYEAVLNHVSAQQLRILSSLARLGGKQPFSRAFLVDSGVTHPGSVKAGLRTLEKKRVVFLKNGEYCFSNPFFGYWLSSMGS